MPSDDEGALYSPEIGDFLGEYFQTDLLLPLLYSLFLNHNLVMNCSSVMGTAMVGFRSVLSRLLLKMPCQRGSILLKS